jgi:pimeloyl-ACP methyl ester carboxylesterase
MRGYNLSEKPRGVRSYRVELLARDVERLILACGEESAVVVGHDWGAAVAWVTAMMHPGRVKRLGILNVPHPERFTRGLLRPAQLLRSSYMFFFQVPRLPEKVLAARDFALLRYTLRNETVHARTFTDEVIELYVEALARPGALTAALNYYRALFRRNPLRARALLQRIEAPVMVIWGERDRFLGKELANPDPSRVPNLRVERLQDASHFVAEDGPDEVNSLLIEFLKFS